jgi:RNA polymerase sigma factor (sigma-70 family)
VLEDLEKTAGRTADAPPDRPCLAPVALPVELEEERLLAALRGGDEAVFAALYRRHVGPLHGLACRLTSRRSEAEELTQEVFVRAWERRADFRSLDHFGHWLRRVAVNSWINRLRKRRELELAVDDDGNPSDEVEAAPTGAPAIRIDLEAALARLSPRLRAVALLFDLYGYGHEEIAAMLEMTPGASKVQLHRARRRLREMLQ